MNVKFVNIFLFRLKFFLLCTVYIFVKQGFTMDVSRIEAISPRQIDWRRLTANQIIKYQEQGVDVPSQYIQWAQNFVNSIYSDDVTTYEKAVSDTNTSQPLTTTTDATVENSDDTTTVDDSTENTEESNKTEAQAKREALQQSGASLAEQAVSFTADSEAGRKSVNESANIITAAQESSVNEIQELENYMSELLAKAEQTQNEFKDEISKINNDKSDKSTFAQINKLQQELLQMGTQGQAQISSTESDLIGFDSSINAQSSTIASAIDFGGETVIIGTELLDFARQGGFFKLLRYLPTARTAINSGNNAISTSEETSALQSEALNTNNASKSTASGFKVQLEAKTGVAASPVSGGESGSRENSDTDNSTTEKSSNKSTTSNDNTDLSNNQNASLDEILKRKIRQGEYVDGANV